jgi:nitrite reductase/ring-hydroxylating ferredoxin subunit
MALRKLLDRIERADGLDRVGEPLRRGVEAVLRGRLSDLLHGVWLGHPLHPATVHVPVGAWMSAAVLDAVPGAEPATTVLVGVGTASALPAAAAGLTDWASLSTEQRRVGLVHATANTVALTLYAGSLVARLRGRRGLGKRLAYAGLGAAGMGAYIGGHMSFRQASAVNHAVPFLRLIPNGWHDLCDEHEVVDGSPVVRRVGEVPVLLARTSKGVTAMIERCGHQAGPLGDGEVARVDGADCVVCPWHGSTFRLADGTVVHGPAGTDQPLLRTRVRSGRIQVAVPGGSMLVASVRERV